jgi:8-oxo-dGTP pyrophosphatase MutT (NUDIX family)
MAGTNDIMSNTIVTSKVLCYIVRDGRLLVFRHRDFGPEVVGIQVPGGTIRPDESPEHAALREAREETGLHRYTIIRKLGEFDYDLGPRHLEVQHRHVFHLALAEPTPHRWFSQEDHDGQRPPTRLECFWIPLEAAHVLQSGQGTLLGRIAL